AELAAKRARLRAAFMSRAISKLQSSQRNVLSADAPTEATDVAAETSNAGTAEAADAATAKTSKMASAEAADVAASADPAEGPAAPKPAMPTPETATTGVRCEGHERNCEQQHRGSGDAGLQHRPHVSEFSQFRFSDRRYRCELLRVAKICRR